MKPERFGRYEVQAEIGDGAMGRVYRALDPVVGRTVAIKTVKTEHLSRKEAPEYLKRFRREAQAAGALSHPHIVSIFDVGDGYLVMEYLEGRTLQDLIKEKGRIEPAEALRILAPVADAIDHAHRAGVIHRDIKPANVMVLEDGRVKLLDFGIAHLASSVMTNTGQVLGSPSYMAPEQVAGLEVTSRTDVYALGVIAYEMVTGQRPFQGGNVTTVIYRIMNQPAAPPHSLNAALPSRYDDVFEQALAKDPAKRFPNAAALVAALDLKEFEEALDAALDPSARPAGSVPPSASPSVAARGPWSWLLGGAAALALVAAAIFWSRSSAPPNEPMLPAAAAPLPEPTTSGPPVPAPEPVVAPSAAPTPRIPRAAVAHAPRKAPPTGPSKGPSPSRLVEGTLVEMGPDVVPPRRIAGQPASYPLDARRRRQQGTVTVSMIVTEAGEPTDLHVVGSAGALLDAAALEAVRTWRFEPARKGGVKVRVRWVANLRFVLEH